MQSHLDNTKLVQGCPNDSDFNSETYEFRTFLLTAKVNDARMDGLLLYTLQIVVRLMAKIAQIHPETLIIFTFRVIVYVLKVV